MQGTNRKSQSWSHNYVKMAKNTVVYSFTLTLLHSEWPKLYRVLAILSAVGLNDYFYRTVELFKTPAFLHVMTIQVHHKLINSIQWHPYVTMETPGGSPYKYWLASCSTESVISVVDVAKVFGNADFLKKESFFP